MKSDTKEPRAKIPATNAARRLRERLTALADRPGTPDEGKIARAKLTRLEAKYDFGQVNVSKEYLFAGQFQPSSGAVPIAAEIRDMDIATWVKWAIEDSTGIRCLFRGSQLCAQATDKTASKLSEIGRTIAGGFTDLWQRFETFPTITPHDRGIFFRGLFDGMLQQASVGERLPSRPHVEKVKRAKKGAIGQAVGMALHPYAVALELGKQLRFNAPIVEVAESLEAKRPKQIA